MVRVALQGLRRAATEAHGVLTAQPWGEPGPMALTLAQQRGENETEDTFLQELKILF